MVGEVHEEVEAGPFLDLVHGRAVVQVGVIAVGFVFHPEAYCASIADGASAIFHPQDELVEIVRYWAFLAGVVRRGHIVDGPAFAYLVERHTCHHIDFLAFGKGLDCIFQVAPDAAVEVVLDLRNLVGDVEGLLLHSLIAVAGTVGAHMTSAIGTAGVGARGEVCLI